MTEHEILVIDKNSETSKIENMLSEKNLSQFRVKMNEILTNKLNQNLFFLDESQESLESKIKIKMSETNNVSISNKKKLLQESILDSGLKTVAENKLEISKRINHIKLDIQNEINTIGQNQLKNKEIFSDLLNNLKNEHIEIIDNFKDYNQEISKKEIVYKKYEADMIENKQLILDSELIENHKGS